MLLVNIYITGALVITCPPPADASASTHECLAGESVRVLMADQREHERKVFWAGQGQPQAELGREVRISFTPLGATSTRRVKSHKSPDGFDSFPDDENRTDHRWAPLVSRLKAGKDRVVWKPECRRGQDGCDALGSRVDFPNAGGKLQACVFASLDGPEGRYNRPLEVAFAGSNLGPGSRPVVEVSRYQVKVQAADGVTIEGVGGSLHFRTSCKDSEQACHEVRPDGNGYVLDLVLSNLPDAEATQEMLVMGDSISSLASVFEFFENAPEIPRVGGNTVTWSPPVCTREYQQFWREWSTGGESDIARFSSPLSPQFCPHLSD